MKSVRGRGGRTPTHLCEIWSVLLGTYRRVSGPRSWAWPEPWAEGSTPHANFQHILRTAVPPQCCSTLKLMTKTVLTLNWVLRNCWVFNSTGWELGTMTGLYGRECCWGQNATLEMYLLMRLLPLGPSERCPLQCSPHPEPWPPGIDPAPATQSTTVGRGF